MHFGTAPLSVRDRWLRPKPGPIWGAILLLGCGTSGPLCAQIDTVLILEWASYLGGPGADRITAMAVDPFGHVYVTGRTDEYWDLGPHVVHQDSLGGGISDAFLVKFAPHGSVLWATYFGGPDMDEGTAIAVDSTQFVYLVGNTLSDTLIATPGSQQQQRVGGQDMFVATFTAEGTLIQATYAGGSDDDAATGACFMRPDRLLVCGWTDSNDLFGSAATPVTPPSGGTDGYVAVFSSAGTLLNHTYTGDAGNDTLVAIAPQDSLRLVVLGNTNSSSGIASANAIQPVLSGDVDGFVMRLDTALAVLAATYFGGTQSDHAAGLAVDSGRVVICGHTLSDTLHTDTTSYQPARRGGTDAFLAVMSDSLQLIWATFLGDTANDRALAVALDIRGAIYVGGYTESLDSIATPDLPQTLMNGPADAFVIKFDSVYARIWGSYIGGTGTETITSLHVIGETAVIMSGVSDSPDELTYFGHQMDYGGGASDGWAARFQQLISTPCNGLCGSGGPSDGFGVCQGSSIALTPYGGALGIGATWMWYANACGDPALFIMAGDTFTYQPDSNLWVCVRAESAYGVSACRCAWVYVIPPILVDMIVPDTVCVGSPFNVEASGGVDYQWWVDDHPIAQGALTSMVIDTAGAHVITVDVTDTVGCVVSGTVSIMVLPLPDPPWILADPTCAGDLSGSILLDVDTPLTYTVSWPDLNLNDIALSGLGAGEYIAVLTDQLGCISVDTLLLVDPPPLLDSIATVAAICITGTGSATAWGPVGLTLTYDWGQGPTDLPMATELPPGIHTLIVQDTLGCMVTTTFHIAPPPAFVAWCEPDTVYAMNGVAVLNAMCSPPDSNATYIWQPAGPLSDPFQSITSASVDSAAIFTVLVISSVGCTDSASVVVLMAPEDPGIPCGAFFLPDRFSPNGDGNNDVFRAFGGCFLSFDLHILDRWGATLFSTTDPGEGWDGMRGGRPAEQGAYVVTLNAMRTTGEHIDHVGTLTLLR